MPGKKNKKDEIDEQLDKLIENASLQTKTLKKLMAEIKKRNIFKETEKSSKKKEK